MVVLEESSLVLHFLKALLVDLKISSRVNVMFCICLVLHILSCKYLVESFGVFFTLKFSFNASTNFCTFWLLHSAWCNLPWKFSVIRLNSGKFLSLSLTFAYEEKTCSSKQKFVKYHEAANFFVCREPYQ